ncbi:MAG: hypothetical protein ACPG06_04010, partial [Alphaproteobacteria bacterium]
MGQPLILIDDSTGAPNACSYLYQNPLTIIRADDLADVERALAAASQAMADGFYIAGFMAYEAGYALEPRLRHLFKPGGGPLVWFGVFKTRTKLSPQESEALWADETGAAENFALSKSLAGYEADIDRIMHWLKAGDAY